MANRAVKRDISTLQNELFLCYGQVILSASNGVPQTAITVNGLTGTLPTLLSGSSPNQFTSQYAVLRNGSGSYSIQMQDVWPRLLSAQFTLGTSGSIAGAAPQHSGFKVFQNTTQQARYDTTSSSGVNAVGFSLVSGSNNDTAGFILKDPTGGLPLVINVSLAFANSSV